MLFFSTGEQLNRDKDVCCNKHKAVMRSKLKKGEFSPEENVIIVRRIEEWGQRGENYLCCIVGDTVRIYFSLLLYSWSIVLEAHLCSV